MLNQLSIRLEAHHPCANHHRAYELALGQDLFGVWIVTIRYGRTGSIGRSRTIPVDSLDDAHRLIRRRLQRRTTAHTRITCDYRLVEYHIDPTLTDRTWLPEAFTSP